MNKKANLLPLKLTRPNNAMTMKMCVSLLVALFFVYSKVAQQASGKERIRIIDADTWNEIDDIPAIMNGLKSDKMDLLSF